MKKIHLDKLVKGSLFVFSISMLANILSYLYQIIMGNLMSVSDFGTINALLSLSLLLSIPSGMITSLSVSMSAYYRATEKRACLVDFTKKMAKYATLFAVAVFAVGVLCSRLIARVLQIENASYVVAAVLIAALGCITTVFTGVLQGLQRFGSYSFYSVVSLGSRLLFSVLFALAGGGLVGGVVALLFSSVTGMLYGMLALQDLWRAPSTEKAVLRHSEIDRYFLRSFWFQLYLLLMSNGDVLLIKIFSSASEAAGVYASGSTIGKIVLYLSNALVAVLFPLVAEKSSLGKSTLSLFKKSILLGGGTVLLCSAGILLLGRLMIPLLFGERYRQAIDLLVPIICYVIPVALLTILINYLMPIGRVRFFAVTMGLAYIVITAIIALWCTETAQMLYVMGGTLFLTFLLNCFWLLAHPSAPASDE